MNLTTVCSTRCKGGKATRETARTQVILLALVCLVLGFGFGAFWYYRGMQKSDDLTTVQSFSSLSDTSKSVLSRLNSPVEIRFYTLLPSETTPDPLRAFAGRVNDLLSEYQHNSKGKINVVRFDSLSESNVTAAWTDGVRPFKVDTADDCYLGLAVVGQNRSESMPQLKTEWEPALEYDLSRIIERVGNPKTENRNPVQPSQADRATVDELKRSLPDLASMSLEEGTQQLREAALKDIKTETAKMEQQIKAAQEHLNLTMESGSKTEQQAARQQLQQLQKEQIEKLQNIARQLQEQLAALESLKATPSQ